MNLQLNYHHLRYFLGVATEGGIKSASERLHVSPPTLSAQVRELEDYLKSPLFLREGRSMVLTDAGRVVKQYALRIIGMGDEMVEVIQRGSLTGPQTVYVGIVDSVPKLLASSILIRTWETHPELKVIMREGLPGELFPALASHQLDVVMANEPAPSSLKTLLHSKRAGRFGVRFVAAPKLKKAFRRQTGLTGFPVLVPTRESPLRRELDRWWAEHGIQPEIRAEFDDAAAMWELAASGAGATPVIEPVLRDVAERFGLRELPLTTGIFEELFVVTAERQFSHEGLRVIVEQAVRAGGKT
ncbi:MAG: LysR family transcriptional regulator [Terrimicrobiaceae bacterium]